MCARENELTEIVCVCASEQVCERMCVRLWTKLAITATALSPFKKGRGEHVKAEASEKEMKRQSGNGQGRALEQMGLAPPPGLYPDLKSVKPPPYVPQQDLQQVQVMVKEGAVEVEIEEMDTMNERIKLLSARMDAAEQQGRSLLRGELEQEGSMHEGDEKSRPWKVTQIYLGQLMKYGKDIWYSTLIGQ